MIVLSDRVRSVALVVSFAVGAHAALAAPAAPTPGAVQQTVQKPRAQLTDHGIQVPNLSGAVARAGQVEPGGTPIPVNRFEFSGNTKISNEALQAELAKSVIGKQLTLAELYEVAIKLTRFYQSQGYPLASVNVPVQRIVDGVVKLEVSEGRIGQVRVEGNRNYQLKVLQEQLSELAGGSVITSAQLERELLLLNDLPGITARVTVVPGAEPGTSDLVVKVEEDTFGFYGSADNYGRADIGAERVSFNTSINGLGRGDALTINLTHSSGNRLNYGRLAYGLPIGTDGGRFEVSYFLNDYTANSLDPLVSSVPGGQSYGVRGEYSYPLVRSRNKNRVLVVAYGGTATESFFNGVSVLGSETKINLADITYLGNDSYGDRHAYSFSLGFSGNGHFSDGLRDQDQCCKLSGEAAIINPVGDRWYSRVRLRAAWAPDILADIEKFSIGGPYSVRGYESSELRGDTGFDSSFELHRPMRIFKGTGEVVLFADAGQVSRRLPENPITPGPDPEAGSLIQDPLLGSVGLGFTAFDVYGFECNLMWATPVGSYTRPDGERPDGQAFLSIGGRF